MKISNIKSIGIVLGSALVVACGSTEYLITKKDGTVIEAHGKPQADEKSGMVTYKDSEGRTMQMQKADVGQIIER